MRLNKQLLAIGAVTGVLTATTSPALASAFRPARPALVSTVRLAASVFPGLHLATRGSDVAASKPMRTVLALKSDTAALDAANARIYDPKSPDYHHFLTAAQIATDFAVPADTEAQARSWATNHGLKITSANPTGSLLFLSGTAAQTERTFGVTLANYSYQGTAFLANTSAATVPAAAMGVIGLNSLLKSHNFSTSSPAVAAGKAVPAQSGCMAGVCDGLTTPQDLWSIYDQPSSDMGEGQKMAIFGEGQTDPVIANLRTFESLHGLRRIPVNVIHTDGPNADYTDDSGEDEWDLDTQSSTGMSPNALEEDLYFGQDLSDTSTLSVLSAWAAHSDAPLQASASYGECEENPVENASGGVLGNLNTPEGGYAGSAGATYTAGYENELTMATAMGQSLFASTGDTGSSCPVVAAAVVGAGNGVANQGFPVVNYPASSPHVVAVGGTVLYGDTADTTDNTSTAKRTLEYSWTFTGGGSSDVFAKPSFQSDIAAVTQPCSINIDGDPATPGETCRGIPDIAAQSGDVASNGYGIVFDGESDFPGGGTSLSSPLSMGMWTRVQAASTKPAGNGFADMTYYAQATKDASQGASNPTDVRDFFDVGGTANSQPSGNGEYTPLPRSAADPEGWDYTSGLGVPDVRNLTQDVDGTVTPRYPALPAEAPIGGTLTPADPACIPAYTDATGDDAFVGDPNTSGSNPQLDIVKGDLHFLNGAVPTLQTVMTIANLSTAGASAGGAANDYYSLWSYGGTQYFTVAEVDSLTKAITYSYGTVVGSMYTPGGTASSGSFNVGLNGTVVVNVPLASVGITAPESSTTLLAPSGQTRVLVGTTATGGLIEQADSGSTGSTNFALGEVCSATGRAGTSGGAGATANPALPEAPYAPLFVLVGASVIGGLVFRRRRVTA